MNNFKLTRTLRDQVQRYRIASVDLLLSELPQETQSRALTILNTNDVFQLFNNEAGTACVCQRRRRLPASTSVARCIATQTFCRASETKRTLLTKPEVKRFFPTLFRHGLPAGYYVDANDGLPVLGICRVDVHFAHISRIWRRSLDLFENHRQQPEFRRLIMGHQFEITWVVATNSKANAIRHLARSRQHDVPIDAQHIPILLNQLAPLPNTFPDVVGL